MDTDIFHHRDAKGAKEETMKKEPEIRNKFL